jgi:xanthine/CO dehydrogenase XdhC/CoxF family maturation factor
VALATVVETWGSAPRPVGSHLVVDEEGNFEGSVSGGCVEGAVVGEAIDVIAAGKPKMLEFGVADETAWRVGLSCGGTIRVYVEKDARGWTRGCQGGGRWPTRAWYRRRPLASVLDHAIPRGNEARRGWQREGVHGSAARSSSVLNETANAARGASSPIVESGEQRLVKRRRLAAIR